jgi:hypothetical protein
MQQQVSYHVSSQGQSFAITTAAAHVSKGFFVSDYQGAPGTMNSSNSISGGLPYTFSTITAAAAAAAVCRRHCLKVPGSSWYHRHAWGPAPCRHLPLFSI